MSLGILLPACAAALLVVGRPWPWGLAAATAALAVSLAVVPRPNRRALSGFALVVAAVTVVAWAARV